MKSIETKLVCEHVRNSRRSDTQLAKILGLSQPTVARTRNRLEREGVINYAGSVDLKKLGFEIMAVTFGKLKNKSGSEMADRIKRGQDFMEKHPEITFFTTGSGLNSDRITLSVHKNYSDYSNFIIGLKTDWEDIIAITGSFLISLKNDNVLRPMTFRYIADILEKEVSNG